MKEIFNMHSSKATRFHYLDHMRGFIIVLVLLQHSVQGYAEQWGGELWFVNLPDRSRAFDIVFMWTDGFIMQGLFFLAGMFVLSSLNNRGWVSFIKEKFIRLFIPMIIGVTFLVPPLRYIRYEDLEEPGISYLTYWTEVYLTPSGISPAGFWFLAFLLVFTFIAAFTNQLFPIVTRAIAATTACLARRPYVGYIVIGLITAILIGFSDLIWGTYWWMGLNSLFGGTKETWVNAFLQLASARSNMLYSYIFFFIIGIGVANSMILTQTDIMEKASANVTKWIGLTFVLSVLYAFYNYTFEFSGAYSDEFRYYLRKGGDFSRAWPLLLDIAPRVLIRTTLHGFLCTAQIFTLMALFYRYANSGEGSQDIGSWASLGACSYGIFYIHEPMVTTMQQLLANIGLPISIKLIITFSITLTASWVITAKLLRKLPLMRRVF